MNWVSSRHQIGMDRNCPDASALIQVEPTIDGRVDELGTRVPHLRNFENIGVDTQGKTLVWMARLTNAQVPNNVGESTR